MINSISNKSSILFLLEIVCFVLGIMSVWFARKENIWVYPTGLISTIITVYLLYTTKDIGNMLVNVYFSIMSLFGWYNWKYGKTTNQEKLKITLASNKDKLIGVGIACFTFILIYFIYFIYDYEISTDNYIDLFTTAIFFTAMWYMANKKLESWILWTVGNIIVIPLYAYKGLILLAIQYIIFTILAVLAYIDWKKSVEK
nr:nicotinamide riboside transporter PnuC [uncultured Flavobacterium sp.]